MPAPTDWATLKATEVERSLEGSPYNRDDVERIAKALREERETCAKIADEECEACDPHHPRLGAGHYMAERIAKRIRKLID